MAVVSYLSDVLVLSVLRHPFISVNPLPSEASTLDRLLRQTGVSKCQPHRAIRALFQVAQVSQSFRILMTWKSLIQGSTLLYSS